MIAATVGAGLLGVVQKYLSALIGESVTFDLRARLFKHLHKRLWEPTRGDVLLDGKSLRTLELKGLRARIGVVTQETCLFEL